MLLHRLCHTYTVVDPALHIPDGFLSLVISLIFWLAAAGADRAGRAADAGQLGERQVPLMASWPLYNSRPDDQTFR